MVNVLPPSGRLNFPNLPLPADPPAPFESDPPDPPAAPATRILTFVASSGISNVYDPVVL